MNAMDLLNAVYHDQYHFLFSNKTVVFAPAHTLKLLPRLLTFQSNLPMLEHLPFYYYIIPITIMIFHRNGKMLGCSNLPTTFHMFGLTKLLDFHQILNISLK